LVSNPGDRRGTGSAVALPVKALDADGSILAEGVARVAKPALLGLPDTTQLAFVRLTWPSGRSETKRVTFDETGRGSATFSDDRISANEWSAWAVPKLNRKTPLVKSGSNVDLQLNRFSRVWLRLWKFSDRQWTLQELKPDATYRNGAVWQLDLTLDQSPWLLQIGGSKVTWRFVSLPGGGPARVLITPKDSIDPRADALKVIVTSFRTDAETLLEFLARDAMRSVETLASSTELATRLFAEKFTDPISALAGAYYLLRVDVWPRIPRWWFENLSQVFHWLPDTALVHCIRLLREGSDVEASQYDARALFAESLERGWPVYGEGVALLQEAAALLRRPDITKEQILFDRVQALGASKAWAGAAASFYGRSPEAPSASQWVGMPSAPRRRRLHPALESSTPQTIRTPDNIALGLAETAAEPPASYVASERRTTQRRRDENEFLLGNITG
jgi:hypothetical protein